MNDSQSSEIFSDDVPSSCNNTNMDTLSYNTLINNVKEGLKNKGLRDANKSSFSKYFSNLFDDCSVCLNQSLDLITSILNTEVNINSISAYLDDAVNVLQMMSDFIKSVVETMSMTCKVMRNFPTITGKIIITVFTHCRDSESLYGDNLRSFEMQLKELFRNCHELQLTYLMVMEKHFVFDLMEQDELGILKEALDINLKIGEIVQTLDVKTMADQWKAYTMICEKYNTHLKHTDIFKDCTQILCSMIKNNISTAIEANQDDKVIIRSLKVASFNIKILLKIYNILKNSLNKDYKHIVDLYNFIHRNGEPYPETANKSSQFIQLLNGNITVPSQCLLRELLMDESFVNIILKCDGDKIKNVENLTIHILIITSVIKYLLNGNKDIKIPKTKIIACIYNILPNAQHCFNQQLKYTTSQQSLGLYEHLLIHTTALATTMNNEEFNSLERQMIEAILSTDCTCALFSSNLWVLLASNTGPQLLFNQLIWLCTMYKKLLSNAMFQRSPQKVHLGETVSRLLEVLHNDDKEKICKQFRINDDDNLSLWAAIKVSNLPNEVKNVAEEAVVEKLKFQYGELANDKSGIVVDTLINLLNLASTCTFRTNRYIDSIIIKAWMRLCPQQLSILQQLDNTTVWFYDYIEALATVTETITEKLKTRSENVVKIVHIVSNLIQKGNTDVRLILVSVLCRLVASDVINYRNRINSDSCSAFSVLFCKSEPIVKHKLIITLSKYKHVNVFYDILTNVNDDIEDVWYKIQEGKHMELIQDQTITNNRYSHKCIEKVILSGSSVQEIRKTISSNFEFDVESLFDESETEPKCKKVKLDEIEIIVSRLENDTSTLCNVKENVFSCEYRTRIKNVCNKLSGLIN